ncbi:MAG: hypothetical protein ACOYYS_10385 [Chloroflexota bacterium]
MLKRLWMTAAALVLMGAFVSRASAETRSGSAFAWKDGYIEFPATLYTMYNGAHESWSDINESTIQVTGRLYVDNIMVHTCVAEHGGTSAACNTTKNYLQPWFALEAKSDHVFWEPTYGDTHFITTYVY